MSRSRQRIRERSGNLLIYPDHDFLDFSVFLREVSPFPLEPRGGSSTAVPGPSLERREVVHREPPGGPTGPTVGRSIEGATGRGPPRKSPEPPRDS